MQTEEQSPDPRCVVVFYNAVTRCLGKLPPGMCERFNALIVTWVKVAGWYTAEAGGRAKEEEDAGTSGTHRYKMRRRVTAQHLC